MHNQIIEQLVEKINTKYCCLNGPFQAPGAPSLTVEREEKTQLSLPSPLCCWLLLPRGWGGGCGLGVFSRHLTWPLGDLEATPLLCSELGRDGRVSCPTVGQGAWVGHSHPSSAQQPCLGMLGGGGQGRGAKAHGAGCQAVRGGTVWRVPGPSAARGGSGAPTRGGSCLGGSSGAPCGRSSERSRARRLGLLPCSTGPGAGACDPGSGFAR